MTYHNNNFRVEKDTMGEIQVPENTYYGAQSARSLKNFAIGSERFSRPFIEAFGILKKSCALANNECGALSDEKCNLITRQQTK